MVNTELLYILKRETGYISGEEISGQLGITRAAIWKHIQELRNLGYDIAAVPHLGYKLLSLPDRLYPWEIKYHLKNKFIGKAVYYYENLSSTMDTAMDLALNGVSEGALIIAEGQTEGRGRMGRLWLSPKYKGIYFSLIIKPKILPQQTPVLTLISAVAICQALKRHLGIEAQIKWPNDILVDDRKVGGILTEMNAEMDAVHAIIVGVGINVNNDKGALPYPAGTLKEAVGYEINRLILLKYILSYFEDKYLQFQRQGVDRILEEWRHFSATLGKRIKLSVVGKRQALIGKAMDIDYDGGLLVRLDSGLTERVVAGDISHCKQ